MRCYVTLFNGEDKITSFDCLDPVIGLASLGHRIIGKAGFEFTSAACYLWEPDKLPERQWRIEID